MCLFRQGAFTCKRRPKCSCVFEKLSHEHNKENRSVFMTFVCANVSRDGFLLILST